MLLNPSRIIVAKSASFLFATAHNEVNTEIDMWPQRTPPPTAAQLVILLILVILFTVTDEADGFNSLKSRIQKVRHARGKYKYKEEIIKRMEHDHPCKLTETAVKVTFPGMKSEVLVSFLGYKEPNLMPVKRCKGLCSNQALSPVACVPTKRRLKKVKMHLKTQYLGHDVHEKFRELVLEEHEECGCQCLSVMPEHCMEPSLFNNISCSCACDTSLYNRDQIRCETFDDRTWDPVTCTCRRTSEGILMAGPGMHQNEASDGAKGGEDGGSGSGTGHNPKRHHHGKKRPGHDTEPAIVGCNGDDCDDDPGVQNNMGAGEAVMPKSTASDYIANNSWTAVLLCTFLVVVFATSTVYYWHKAKKMAKDMFVDDDDEDDSPAEDNVPSPPPPVNNGKVVHKVDLSSPTEHKIIETRHLIKNNPKSPVEDVNKLLVVSCDSKPQQQKLLSSNDNIVDLTDLQKHHPMPHSESKGMMMANGVKLSSSATLDRSFNRSKRKVNVVEAEPENNIMTLLMHAAAAKSSRERQEAMHNGMAKAASMSELEASQLVPDHNHVGHRHVVHHGDGGGHHHHSSSGRSATHRSSSVAVNVHQHHQPYAAEVDEINLDDMHPALCGDCVHYASLSRPPRHRQQHHAQAGRHVLKHQHSFHHPLPVQPPPQVPHHHHSVERRVSRSRSRRDSKSRLHHGSHGQLLDNEELLQQCLATLVMDAAILRQQQQLQHEQLLQQQEQLELQQNVIQQVGAAAGGSGFLPLQPQVEVEATDSLSIDSIAGDGVSRTVGVGGGRLRHDSCTSPSAPSPC
jgi:hypothetical protein